MAGTATNVTAGKPNVAGAVFCAPVGSTLPIDATTALGAAFKDLGFVSEDGVTRSISKSTTNIKEWGGGVVLITQDEKTTTIKLKLIEYLNADVQKFVHGDSNVSGTIAEGLAIHINDAEDQEHSIVIEQIMRGGIPQRLVIPRGVITEIGDTVYRGNDTVAYDLTITALKSDDGNMINEYIGGGE